jgi:3-oxoacyl-[acyl-carrier-protein] synthase II
MASHWTERRVVITGLGVVSALGNDLHTFWDNIVGGQCGIDRITAFDATAYDCKIAAEVRTFDPTPALPSPKEARRTDRFAQFSLHAGWQALRDSGLSLDQCDRDRIGCFIGSGIGGLHTMEEQHSVLLEPRTGAALTLPDSHAHSQHRVGSFSIYHKLRGPNVATCSACATSMHTLGEAWRTIKMDDADVIFAGVRKRRLFPWASAAFCAMRALSTRNDDPKHASRPFDKSATDS